jgi:ABC-2 type transport system ATP-binding protein
VTGAAGLAAGGVAAGSPGAAAIETHELRKEFGKIVALAGLTMTVPRGEVFGFLGPNGAGKTTAVKLLLGLSRPTTGEGLVLGAPLGDVASRRRVGYLPELFRYQSWMTAREVLALHCELAGLPRADWQPEIRAAVDLVGLADRADGRTGTYSKGMQQRLGLAVALLGRPDLVVLDEPTSALDPVGRQDVRRIIGALRDRGTTVFLNSHLLTEVERVCDRVAIVDHGRVVSELTMAELGRDRGVSVRVTGLDGMGRELAGRYGPTRVDGEWLHVDGIAEADVPALVGQLVARGGAIHAVMPTHHSLEDRFMALLGAPQDADPSAATDPAGGGPAASGGPAAGGLAAGGGPAAAPPPTTPEEAQP